ncbi:spore germination protein KC [Bacillus mesophilus]|uniref:Ger(X)C family spore germination protein n=1 Tax=Bacillus mesophilus TaxID=1808955 RepID=A0A6M0Q4K7_9BACI|nr:Ger(x)C family spore germination protein [Bacillus mesophilus]MBM7661317.1 spore germination protein KC [Bacillus mesophilus]NEY71163.1 Ger(x)C family spore germination protein [Bacillus mesophilus]
MNRNVKKILKLMTLLLILFSLSSCGYKDIDKRFFVVSIGIDESKKRDQKYKVTLKLAVPAADPKSGVPESVVVEEDSTTITGAVRLMKSKIDKELDFSHAKIIVISKEVAENNIKEVLDWFIRRRDIQKVAFLAIGEPSAKEILDIQPKSERVPSNSLFLIFGKTGTESPYIVTEYLFDFWKRLREKGLDPLLPIIEVHDNGELFDVHKSALFNKESLQTTLSTKETKVLRILMNRASKLDVEVKSQEDEQIFIAVDLAKTNIKINKETIDIDVQLEGIVEEATGHMDKSDIPKVKELAEKQVKERVEGLLQKIQKEELDPVGFGLLYRASHSYKNEYEDWLEMYPKIKFNVNVEMTLQGTGLLN